MQSFFLKFLFLSLFLNSISGAEPLKIVYNESTPPLKFTDQLNNANGIIIDVWKYWAEKNNIEIKFIEATWEDSFTMIQDGRADIHAGLYYTLDRDKTLDFSNRTLYKNKNYFFYNKQIIDARSIKDLKPFVIGLGNGYSNPFMKEHYKNYYTKTYKTDDDLSRAFVDGEVNVALTAMSTMTYYIKKHKLDMNQYKYSDMTHAYTKDYFGAVKKGNKKVLDIINKGFENISDEELRNIEKKWTIYLNENYLKDYHNTNDVLKKKHKNYLLKKQEIKMCVDPKWLPFEAIENGKHTGIIADIYKEEFQKKLPIPIKLIPTQTWTQTLQFAKDRKCDILAGAARTPSRVEYLNFTQPYLKFPEVIATRENEPFIENFESIIDKKIGIVDGSAVVELIRKKYPDINLVPVTSVSDGLMQVSEGKLFGFVNTSTSISYYISKEGMTNIKIAAKVGIDYHLAAAVRNDDLELLDIFNILIASRNIDNINDIKEKWVQVKVQEMIDYTIIYKTIAFFIVIIAVILYWNRKLNKEILEREKVQKDLDTLSQVIEQSRVSVIITDLEGKIKYINPFCCKKTGYLKDELIGNNPRILKSGYHNEAFYKKLWETITSGKTWQSEFSNKKKNGDIFWESATIAPIFSKGGNIQYFASIKEDITERVISREKLQLAQEEAIKANSAKSEFLAKMSHEIRTPMNAVLGMLYLLEQTEISSVQDNYIKKASRAASSLLNIINDILDFSKIEAGKLDIKNDEFEFNNMIMSVLSVMSFKAEEKELELLAKYDNKMPPYIISDRLRIEQILTNLLSNAIKFTNHGEILISSKVVKIENNEVEILFTVKDNGIGISKEAQEKLFQEFSQVDSSTTRSFQGTGLGLAICKKLSELLGGRIWIEESREGIGSVFSFTIKAIQSQKKLENKYAKLKHHNLKCLVVDDSYSAVEILKAMLESFGFEVKTASCGKDAIAIIKKEKFDLVFLDFKMDGLNGVETFKLVKQDLEQNGTKTIMVSAYSKDIIGEDIHDIGIDGYLSKPTSPSSLYNKIFEVENSIKILPKQEPSNKVVKYFDGIKILLVEDNELNQEFAVHMLEDRGFNVDVASDGIEALSKVKDKKYDLVLMDIQMPHMDGLEATQNIRKMKGEYFRTLPIVALSANALLGDKEKSIKAGMNNHITKPINPDELFEIISLYVESQEKLIDYGDVILQDSKDIEHLSRDIFDVETTLEKLNQSHEVYIKILKQFSTNYQNIMQMIKDFINDDNMEALKSKIHEIKGVSGNIGAIKLYEKLVIIDRIVKSDEFPSGKLIDEVEFEINEVFQAIEPLHESQVDLKEFNQAKVVKLLKELKTNLDEDIVKCETILKTVTPYLKGDFSSFIEELTKLVNGYDTDGAKVVIDKFIKSMVGK